MRLPGSTEGHAVTCEPTAQRSYRLGYADAWQACARAFYDLLVQGLGRTAAYSALADHWELLDAWSRGDPGLLQPPPAWRAP